MTHYLPTNVRPEEPWLLAGSQRLPTQSQPLGSFRLCLEQQNMRFQFQMNSAIETVVSDKTFDGRDHRKEFTPVFQL